MKTELEVMKKIEELHENNNPLWDDMREYEEGSPYYERAKNRLQINQGMIQALQWVRGREGFYL